MQDYPLATDGRHLYRELKSELREAGCFEPLLAATIARAFIGYATMLVCYLALLTDPIWYVRIPVLAVMAFACIQTGFLGHEAGHGSLTSNRRRAFWLGQVFMTFPTGLGASHFQKIHRSHHPHCNERADDPDMQSGVVSLYQQSASEKRGVVRWITRYQTWLFWPLVSLQGLSIKLDGLSTLKHTLHTRTAKTEIGILALHAFVFAAVPMFLLGFWTGLVNYAVWTWFIGPYLGAIFLANHIGTRIIAPGEQLTFFEQQVTTTRNLPEGRLHSFIFGGLVHHVEHHLFPSIPDARLGKARVITRAFCKRHNIPYRETTWWCAIREVGAHIHDVSKYAGTRCNSEQAESTA